MFPDQFYRLLYLPAVAEAGQRRPARGGAEDAGKRRGEFVWATSSSRRRRREGIAAAGDLPNPAPAAAGARKRPGTRAGRRGMRRQPWRRLAPWEAAQLSSVRAAAQVGSCGGTGGQGRHRWTAAQVRLARATVAGAWWLGLVQAVAGAGCCRGREEEGEGVISNRFKSVRAFLQKCK